MIEYIQQWLAKQGVPERYLMLGSDAIGLLLTMLLCGIGFYLTRHQLLKFVHRIVVASHNTWDDLLLQHKVFSRIALLLPFILLLLLTPHLLPADSMLSNALIVAAKIGVCFQVAHSISALLNVANSLYLRSSNQRYLPINATIQVIKLTVYLVAIILAISFLLNRSPIYLLSGLGALTAVLLLVFQDTIKGLVASIQISANRMVAPGDWIEMPQYGADGDVLEIGLNTVKVRNFDRTVTTIPTYALISESFKNWRDMFNSGGRRIKRTLTFDINSIHFCSSDELKQFAQIRLIQDYLAQKQREISASNQQAGIDDSDMANARKLTNIGTFRAYIEAYLAQHAKVQQQMTCMVRQLPASATGLPLELYFFSNDQQWVNYERIQADIFDHLFAMAPLFNLKIFQHPSGADWQKALAK